MDDFEDILDVYELGEVILNVGNRIVRRRERFEPFSLPDREFKARYRFSKDGLRHLTDILRPQLTEEIRSNRGLPFSPEEIETSCLDILGGGHFQRVQGACSQSGTSSVHKNLYR